MPGRHLHNRCGFTVVELMISLSIFLLVLGGIFQIFGPSNVMYAAGHRKLDAQQSARVVMDMIVRQIRMTGYFPENFDTLSIGLPPAGNDIDAAAPQNLPIQVGTDTALAIYGAATGCLDANADLVCDDPQPAAQSGVVLFCLNGTDLVSKAGPLGQPGSYTCAPDNVGQQVVASNVTGLTFTYYGANNNLLPGPLDGQGVGAVPAGPTAQRAAVRIVTISLTAQENVPGQSPQVYTLTSNVRIRNLN